MYVPKTPSSLKWLLDRRARIAGEIAKSQDAEGERLEALQAELARIDTQRAKLVLAGDRMASAHTSLCEALCRDLAAIDQVLQLHEVSIDLSLLPPVRGHNRIAATDHGQMTRLIFACLRSSCGKACTTTQVALYVASKLGSTGRTENFDDLRYRVRYRLKKLVSEQRLERLHEVKGRIEGSWRLPLVSSRPETRLLDGALASTLATTAIDHN